MQSRTLVKGVAGTFALCLVAGALAAAPAAAGAVAPWFGSGGFRPIPFGRPPGPAAQGLRREGPFIRHLYRGFLGREPANDEVRAWQRVLGDRAGATEVIRSFMESDEFFIRQAYLGLLRREPDSSGMDSFTRALRDGRSRADVIESILDSDEFHRL
ncbi:MAG TPA: DUF4214 domain-containing protein, partial [Candidatus Methanoperedens sp.]|nr:DUF4214 domain-containing protein [Candidatus Methanoperedens sp.]